MVDFHGGDLSFFASFVTLSSVLSDDPFKTSWMFDLNQHGNFPGRRDEFFDVEYGMR